MSDFAARRSQLWTRLGGNGPLATGGAIWAFILLASLAGPFVIGRDPYALHTDAVLQAPNWRFPLGTDELGRDALARLLAGGFSTLIVALPSALLIFLVGTAYGLISGLGPSWLDKLLMRLLDAVLALPSLIVLIFFASLVKLNDISLILLLGLISWPGLARLVRNEAIAQRERDFVLATRQLGASTWYIARVHLLRVIAPLLVVNGTLLVGDSIFLLSALSFLGLGVQPPYTSWGGLIQESLGLLLLDPWWLIVPPGLMVFASLLAASLFGQGLLARWDARR
jgi:peptide/nickel transport system permease protein